MDTRHSQSNKSLILYFVWLLLYMLLFARPATAQLIDSAMYNLNQAIGVINVLDSGAFKNKRSQQALIKKIDTVLKMVGNNQCVSARNKLENDIHAKANGCSVLRMPDDNDWLTTCEAQKQIDPILAATATMLTTACINEEEYEIPSFLQSDLYVSKITLDPERGDPGETITIRATIANYGEADATSGNIRFSLNNDYIGSVTFGALEAGAKRELTKLFIADKSGSNQISASIEPGAGVFDPVSSNNYQSAFFWISGEADPKPALVYDATDFDSLNLTVGSPATIPVTVRNPTFAAIDGVPAVYYIDNELVCTPGVVIDSQLAAEVSSTVFRTLSHIHEDPRCSRGLIPLVDLLELAPGERQQLAIPWNIVTRGQHTFAVELLLNEVVFPDANAQRITAWTINVNDVTYLVDESGPDKWVSLGPSLIDDGIGEDESIGSVGRIDTIAFHPSDAGIQYSGAVTGGIWKSESRGNTWAPVGDKLVSLNISAIAVDPQTPEIVYASTGKGIVKSQDGGIIWDRFADTITTTRNNLVIRYTENGEVLIYAGTANGLFRYTSADPRAKTSTASEWIEIKSGRIANNSMVAHPSNNSTLYISVEKSGLWRTRNADAIPDVTDPNNVAYWTQLVLPGSSATDQRLQLLDIFQSNPRTLYAAIQGPSGHENEIGLSRSGNEGDDWTFLKYGKWDGYLDFLKVNPSDENYVYHGGVSFFKEYLNKQQNGQYPATTQVRGVHADMKGLRFDPFHDRAHPFSTLYYVHSDGGIWRCEVIAGAVSDDCQTKNSNLRVTQFFDIDASQTNGRLMIGGTQDNNTIKWEGEVGPYGPYDFWEAIRYGDGNYSLIGPNSDDMIMYSQEQYLCDTKRSEDGGQSWYEIGRNIGAPCVTYDKKLWSQEGLGWDGAWITVSPKDPDYLVSKRWFTKNGGQSWTPHQYGNTTINRVVFQTSTNYWFAGTTTGEIIFSDGKLKNPYFPSLNLHHHVWTHPDYARVQSMAFSPTNPNILYVLFTGGPSYRRVVRLELVQIDPEEVTQQVNHRYVGQGLVSNIGLNVISGDGHNDSIAYVGSNEGVYQLDLNATGPNLWQPYSEALPMVEVRDLLVDPITKDLRAATWGRGAWAAITGP